jgi:hypothetical protein
MGCGTNSNTNRPEKEEYTGPYYEGTGGKGIRVAVLRPDGKDLAQNEQWLLDMIQGSITSDFSKYTAMTVIDRQNLDKILENQMEAASGNYSDDDYVSIGNLTNAKYITIGKLAKIPGNNYLFELSISDSSKGERIASYPSQVCSYEQLANMTIIKTATGDLLNQLGIILTDSGKTALFHVNSATMNSEAALSKGLVAQRGGTVVEAMSYYYDAVSYDSSLREATSLLNKLSSEISSGNIGENVRNDIERRRQWLKILEEAENYFKEHLPWEIVYDPTLTQGKTDYSRETVELSFNLEVRPTDGWKIIQDLIDGLDATGKRDEWGLTWWPLTSRVFADYAEGYSTDQLYRYVDLAGDYAKQTSIICGLLNEEGKLLVSETINCISKATFDIAGWYNPRDENIPTRGYREYITSDNFFLIRNNFISTATGSKNVTFKEVNANDITENMTVKIISVNGINAETLAKNGYIKITTGKIE